MSPAAIVTESQPLILHLGFLLQKMSDHEFFAFCQLHPEWRMERTSEGDLVIMPSTGGWTGTRNFTLIGLFSRWVEADGTGLGFDSPTGFTLPNGAKRSPDLAWVTRARWEALTAEEQEEFPPLCPDFVVELRSRSLPEMPFRPYTVLGLFAHAMPLYDPHGIVAGLRAQLSPYPPALRANLLGASLPIMTDGLAELRNYTRRNIGPSAFLLHLERVCDAMVSLLYALNEHYDPATKRPEQELRKLAMLPDRFVARFVRLLEGPFDLRSRPHMVDELTSLVGEVTHLAHRVLAELL